MNQGEICIFNDNKKLLREIDKRRKKESDCTQEAGAVVTVIRRELECTSIDIKLKYANNKPRANLPFELQLGVVLMKKCDDEAKKKCKMIIDNNKVCNIKHTGIVAPIVNNQLIDKNINVLIREIDAKKMQIIIGKRKSERRMGMG